MLHLLIDDLRSCEIIFVHIEQVLDEADRLLNDDFEKSLDEILNVIPRTRKTYLFSATMTKKVYNFYNNAGTVSLILQIHSTKCGRMALFWFYGD